MDEILNPVATEIICASKIIAIVPHKPATPVTHPRRKYMITPRMVSTEGVKTPANDQTDGFVVGLF